MAYSTILLCFLMMMAASCSIITDDNRKKQIWDRLDDHERSQIRSHNLICYKSFYSIPQIGVAIAFRYRLDKLLGEGAAGSVYSATDMCSRKSLSVAVKIIKRNVSVRNRRVMQQQLKTELQTMKSIKDPSSHCISLINAYELGEQAILVMPLFQKDAYKEANALAKSDPATILKLAQQVSKQTLQCLRYLHSMSIVHNDVKPENIQLRKVYDDQSQQLQYYAVLGDYSHSVILDQQQSVLWKVGTRLYQAPEVSLFRRGSTAIDMWSLGLTLFTIWNPQGFDQLDRYITETLNNVKVLSIDSQSDGSQDDEVQMDKALLRRFDDITGRFKGFLGQDFLSRAFLYKNIDIKLLKHFYDFVSKCLSADPDRRLAVSEALEHPFVAMAS